MAIKYDKGTALELWVRDEGVLEGYTLFINGRRIRDVSDGQLRAFPIERPNSPMAVAVLFGGRDGGKSAIVDVTDPANKRLVGEAQLGLRHVYEVEP